MRLNWVKWPTTEPLLGSAGSLEYGLSRLAAIANAMGFPTGM